MNDLRVTVEKGGVYRFSPSLSKARAQVAGVIREGRQPLTESRGIRLAAIVIACLVWGSTFLFGKIALSELTVLQLIVGRFGVAAVVLVPFAVAAREWPRRRDWPTFTLAALLGVPVTFILQFGGLSLTTSTDASFIVGGFPLLMAIAGVWLQEERLGSIGWVAVLMSTVGVGLVVGSPEGGWIGRLLVLLSMVSAVAWVVLTKRLLSNYSPIAATAWVLVLGTVMTLPIAFLVDGLPTQNLSAGVIGSVLTLGIACTALTYTIWNWGIQRIEASRAGVFVNLEPVVGAYLGVTVLGDPLTSWSFVGGCIVVICAVMVCLPNVSVRIRTKGGYNEIRSDANGHDHRPYDSRRRFWFPNRVGRFIADSSNQGSQAFVVRSVGRAQK